MLNMSKDSYSVYEAKAKLSEIIRKVRRKKRIVITHNGQPVASVVPFEAEQLSTEDKLRQLEEQGLISTARASLADIKFIESCPGALERFLDERRD
jgi:prevent-host-death family protein